MIMQLTGWAIIHSLWEGGLIALVVAALLAATRRSSPQTRYAISVIALALMVIAPLATALRSVSDSATSTFLNQATKYTKDSKDTKNSLTAYEGNTQASNQSPELADMQPSPIVSGGSNIENRLVPSIKERLDPAIPWVVLLWMIGLSLASIRLIGGYARTKALRKSGSSDSASAIEVRVRGLAERLGISRIVDAIESTTVDVPLVVGAMRPLIVVPASLVTGLTPVQLDMLLAHELAHIRRHDYLVNLFQTVVETLLFYHPAVRWVSERAREERENCCDDVAIALCGVNPSEYTSTLLVLEESRGQAIGFATAATGGSLLRRAVRLLTGQTPRVELGPLWFAGLLTISAALFTGREAYADIRSSYVPASFFAANDSTKKDKSKDPEKNPDPSRAAPSEVVNASAGSLEQKWKWAERSRGGEFWIGYLVGGNTTGARYYTSNIPIRLQGNVTLSGHMQMMDGDMSGATFYGTPLRNYFGTHAPGSTAIFFKSVPGLTGRHIERMRLASYALTGYFDKLPVVWLDSVSDAESVPLIRSLLARGADDDMRRDLVSAIGVHNDAAVTTPVLVGLLQSGEREGIRREAADGLGHSRDPRAMSALSRAARSDNSSGVRRESIEAIGSIDHPAATDTLIRFIQTLEGDDVRRTAVEALGNRSDARVVPYLTSLIHSNAESKIRETALESLVDGSPDASALVIDVARNDADSRMRRNAVEYIPKVVQPDKALTVLRDIVYGNDDESVRRQAVETIGNLETSGSARVLKEIIDSKQVDERVQSQAVESISHTVENNGDVSLLADIARNHPSERVRREALESISHVANNKVAIDILMSAARSDPVESVRATALEQLAEGDDPNGMKALASLVRGKDQLDLRMRALSVYTESAEPADAVALIKAVLASDESVDMQLKALNALEDVKDNAGLAVLRQVAQSNPDQRLRSKAARILDDR